MSCHTFEETERQCHTNKEGLNVITIQKGKNILDFNIIEHLEELEKDVTRTRTLLLSPALIMINSNQPYSF